jgi:hypothetical protein
MQRDVQGGEMEEFYLSMSKAIKDRDHALARMEWWRGKVVQAEADIESLVASQHVEAADQTPEES